MVVDRAGGDGAAAGHRDPGRAEPGQHGRQDGKRSAHPFDELIRGFPGPELRRVNLEGAIAAVLGLDADRLQHLHHRVDIADVRHVPKDTGTFTQQRASHNSERGVLAAANPNRSGKGGTATDVNLFQA